MDHLPPKILGWGMWKLDDISITIQSENRGQIRYGKQMVNVDRKVINVYCFFWERWKGITLEQKMHERLDKLVNELMADNTRIQRLYDMRRRLMEQRNNDA